MKRALITICLLASLSLAGSGCVAFTPLGGIIIATSAGAYAAVKYHGDASIDEQQCDEQREASIEEGK